MRYKTPLTLLFCSAEAHHCHAQNGKGKDHPHQPVVRIYIKSSALKLCFSEGFLYSLNPSTAQTVAEVILTVRAELRSVLLRLLNCRYGADRPKVFGPLSEGTVPSYLNGMTIP